MDNIQPGQTIGAYRVIHQIGQGGMATVYKAYHAAMDRYVAVKVLPRQLAENPEFTGRFQQEARTIARLEHARILPVYDYGESDGLTYLVMRYLDAGTLKDRMKAGPLPLTEVDRLFTQLAEALEYAHAQGIIHRDLKPSNVLIDQQGNLFLTDFGIAKLLEGGMHLTTTGALVGTPAYMSPEQAQGEKVDQRTDIYSLGIILYEMTTGRVPFEAETPLAVVLKQINAPLPLPSEIKPDFSPAIERVLLKALGKMPADRFNSVGEFLAAWKRALTEAPTLQAAAPVTAEIKAAMPTVAAPPLTAPPSVPSTRKPLPVAWIIGGVVGVVIVGLALAAIIGPRLRDRTTDRTSEPRATATEALVVAATDVAPTEAPASEGEATEPSAETTDFAWQSWTAANRVFTLRVHDGQLYAVGPGGITVWDPDTGEVEARYTTGDGLPHPNVFSVWVDDDETLWAATEAGLGRRDPDTEEWTLYDTSDGLDSNLTTTVVRAGEFLIVGTQYSGREGGGLMVFDGRVWQSVPDFPSTEADRALAEGKLANAVNVLLPMEEQLWVGTEVGLGVYDQPSNTWTRFTTADGLPDNRILSLYLDQEGAMWVGTAAGAARFNGATFDTTEQGPPYGVYGIVQDARGRYYFSGGGGIWRYDSSIADWQEFSNQTGDLPVYEVFGAVEADEVLYFGTDGAGLLRYDGDGFTPWYQEDATVRAWFGAILPVPDGSQLWFVEVYGGYADRFDLSANAWEAFTTDPCACAPLAFDANGNLWGTRWEEGVFIQAPDGTVVQVSAAQGLPVDHNVRLALPLNDGTAWLGTDLGLAYYDGQNVTGIFTAADTGFASDFVRSMFLASDGSLWVSMDGSVSRLTPEGTWEHFTVGNPFTPNFGWASDFAEDQEGGLWVATQADWAYYYLDGQWTQVADGLPSPYVNAVTLAPEGALWFATNDGAAYFDGSDWTTYHIADGLINDFVYDIFVEPSGVVWFATNGGATRYGP